MSLPLEQPEAVRALYDCASSAISVGSALLSEVEANSRASLSFARQWMSAPDTCDPCAVHESFGRMALLHAQLGALIAQQRESLDALPARLVVQDDPGRESVIDALREQGVKGG